MARIRQVKPEFCTSPDASALSREARLFFLLLLTEADDKGRLIDSPKKLAGCLYPHDEDVTARKITRWVNECVDRDMLRRYEADGLRCLSVVTFAKHQKISHPSPSKLPSPPWEVPEPSGNSPEPFPKDSGPVLVGVEGRGKGRGSPSSSESDSRPPPAGPEEEVELHRTALAAIEVLSHRHLKATRSKVVDIQAWLATARGRLKAEHWARALELLAQEPALSAGVLADRLEPPTPAPGYAVPKPFEERRDIPLEAAAEIAGAHLAAVRGALRPEPEEVAP